MAPTPTPEPAADAPPPGDVPDIPAGTERRPASDVRTGDVLVVGGEVTGNDDKGDGTHYLQTALMGAQVVTSTAAVLVVVDPGVYARLLHDI